MREYESAKVRGCGGPPGVSSPMTCPSVPCPGDVAADLGRLADALLPFAQRMLCERGAFAPFGATMAVDGTISVQMAGGGAGDPRRAIEAMADVFRRAACARGLRATGLCYDVRIVHPGTGRPAGAACAELEHAGGRALHLLLPYRKRLFRAPRFDAPVGSEAEGRIFPPPARPITP